MVRWFWSEGHRGKCSWAVISPPMYKSCTRFDIDRVETFEDSGPGIRQIKVKILRVLSELAARGLLIKALTHYQEE